MKRYGWLSGFMKKREEDEAALKKAAEDIEALKKSKEENQEPDAMAELEKALSDFDNEFGDPLEKSKDDDKGGDDGKDGDDGKGGDSGGDDDDLGKSLDYDDLSPEELQDELVKASESFDELRKSVEEGHEQQSAAFEVLAKSIKANTDLTIKIGQGLVGLQKALNEKLEILGKQPVGYRPTVGMFKSQDDDGNGEKTSLDEARTLLIKSMEDGEVLPPGLLTRLDTKKDTSVIPEELREKLGIKV
jgi:hypothetical protein